MGEKTSMELNGIKSKRLAALTNSCLYQGTIGLSDPYPYNEMFLSDQQMKLSFVLLP
jgi:hypothetical protein